jgi:hypothetical protein
MQVQTELLSNGQKPKKPESWILLRLIKMSRTGASSGRMAEVHEETFEPQRR